MRLGVVGEVAATTTRSTSCEVDAIQCRIFYDLILALIGLPKIKRVILERQAISLD